MTNKKVKCSECGDVCTNGFWVCDACENQKQKISKEQCEKMTEAEVTKLFLNGRR